MSSDEFATAIGIIANGDTPEETRQAAAQGLGTYLDDIGEAAQSGDSERYARPTLVDFFAEIGHDDQAVDLLLQPITTWSMELGQTLVENPNYTEHDIEDTYQPVASIVAATSHGLDESNSSTDGDDFRRMVILEASLQLAQAIADEQGIEMPAVPTSEDEFDDYLPEVGADGWVDEVRDILQESSTEYLGNPIRLLERMIIEEYETHDADGHW